MRCVLTSDRKSARVLDLLAAVGQEPAPAVYEAPQTLVEQIVGFPMHRGVVASVARLPLPTPESLLEGPGPFLIVEGVNDHENLGALFRNAAAFGVGAVLLDRTCADPLYRRSVRVSIGHVLHLPWTAGHPTAALLRAAQDRGVATAALTPDGAEDVRTVVRRLRDRPVAWVVGAEGPGLEPMTMRAASTTARIPMADGVDSLNVATATAVALAVSWPDRG